MTPKLARLFTRYDAQVAKAQRKYDRRVMKAMRPVLAEIARKPDETDAAPVVQTGPGGDFTRKIMAGEL